MELASWNVNSLKVRLPQLLEWLIVRQPDIVCLQETKLEDAKFPRLEIEAAGYSGAFAGQKTYNGVALLARQPLVDIAIGNPYFPDPQQRLIAATIGGIRVICAYVPNGQEVGSEKYAYKLAWLAARTRIWPSPAISTSRRMTVMGITRLPGQAKFFVRRPSAPPSARCSIAV